ncbi:lachrymatory-factor synthase [Malania oleifera]|uniref:lachrymatory-factor synthase n=1 Tax=Malania oleifera TaxID=397392 RepID=UPI0025AE88BB|nr:lachrymatory-factor synthase [Malania oleifera]
MEHRSEAKWEGKASARLSRARADQIWPLFTDFFNLHNWFPTLSTCYGLQGTNGQPGCVRYCAGFSIKSPSGDGDGDEDSTPVNWSKERLVALDPMERSLTYEIVDSSIGFESYTSTVKVSPAGEEGCVIEWWFAVDPVEGWRLEDLRKKYDVGLQRMAERMEKAVADLKDGDGCTGFRTTVA